MSYKTLILILTWSATLPLSRATEGKTALVPIKDSTRPTPIAIDARGFYELLREGNLFIDTSLLIKEALSFDNVKLIVRPKGWGKSINLDMMKNFFEVCMTPSGEIMEREKTRNFRLFYEGRYRNRDGTWMELSHLLLISYETELLSEYMGRHAVVSIKLDNLKPKNYDQFIKLLQRRICDTFREHSYMLTRLDRLIKYTDTRETVREKAKIQYNLFQKHLNGTANREEFLDAIAFLCNLLEENTLRKPIILIDDYDYPLNQILFADNVEPLTIKQTVEFYRTFLNRAFVPSTHYETAVITGIFRLMEGLEFQSSVLQFDTVDDERFSYFYGFSDYDVELISDHLNISADQRQHIKLHFGGYHGGGQAQLNITRPASLAKFLKTREIHVAYDEFDWIDGYLFNRVAVEYLRQELHFICTWNPYSVRRDQRFAQLDLVRIGRLSTYDPETQSNDVESAIQTVIDMLFALGYLTPKILTPGTFTVVTPNEETRLTIKRKIMKYYAVRLGIRGQEGTIWTSLFRLSNDLREFMYSKDNTSSHLALQFEGFFKLVPPFNPSPKRGAIRVPMSDFILRASLNYITLFMDKFRYFPSETSCVYNTTKLFAGVFLIDETRHGVLLQMTRGENDTSVALGDVMQLNYVAIVKTLKRIGINVLLNQTVQLDAEEIVTFNKLIEAWKNAQDEKGKQFLKGNMLGKLESLIKRKKEAY